MEGKFAGLYCGRFIKLLFGLTVFLAPLFISGQVITPADSYSSPDWREKARKYEASLVRVQKDLAGTYSSNELQLADVKESQAGGIGFWPNPGGTSPDARYLCVFIKTMIPPQTTGRPFNQQTRNGRLLAVWDAYGKHIVGLFDKELEKIDDGSVKGGALVIIYSKKSPQAEDFCASCEGFALFMPSGVVKSYAAHRMTNQSLFQKSRMFGILEGRDQVSALYTLFYP